MRSDTKLLSGTIACGCSAKISPSELSGMLDGLPFRPDPNLLVGMEKPDDAGVYKISDEIALIQTVDFFPPIVDDPFLFGRIAAANALSDVYAMGGKPLTALNIFCFPVAAMARQVARDVLAGGLAALSEADCSLVGGHSVADDQLKYGLAVTGTVHPSAMKTKAACRTGDAILLTKPIGTGIVSSAVKAGFADGSELAEIAESMSFLNRAACETMLEFDVAACTDVTGFGLMGHLYECMHGSGKTCSVSVERIPFFRNVFRYASMGLMNAGLYKNRSFYLSHITVPENMDEIQLYSLFDPQTSGGLLIFVRQEEAESLRAALRERGVPAASIIGRVTGDSPGAIELHV